MDCSTVADHLSPLADGELEGREAETVRAHLDNCHHCHKLFKDLVKLKRLVPEVLPFEKAPPGLKSAILEKLDSSRIGDFFHLVFARLRAQPILASTVTVTMFLAVFAAALWVVNSHRLPPLIREVLGHHAEAHEYPLEVATADPSRLAKEVSLRLKKEINVPDLKSNKCTLMGFRECAVCLKSAVEIRYSHRDTNLSLFVVPVADGDEISRLCKPNTLRKKQMDGQTYYYCEGKSGQAVFWWEENDVFLVTTGAAFPMPFETAREIRRSAAERKP